MSVLLITYDLRQPGRNYQGLHQAIKTTGNWIKVLESVWLVSTQLTTSAVRDRLRQHMDSNDGLFVAQQGPQAAWVNTSANTSDAIKRAFEAQVI
jgi:hypothetical protein